MHRILAPLLLSLLLAGCAAFPFAGPSEVHGYVVDTAGRPVAGAWVQGFHTVPTEGARDPSKPPPWDGLLGETYTDARGAFALSLSGRASLDYILAERGNHTGSLGRRQFAAESRGCGFHNGWFYTEGRCGRA